MPWEQVSDGDRQAWEEDAALHEQLKDEPAYQESYREAVMGGEWIWVEAESVEPDKAPPPPVPRLAYNMTEAARSLGVADETFASQIKSQLPIIRVGRKQMVAVRELERWMEEHGDRRP